MKIISALLPIILVGCATAPQQKDIFTTCKKAYEGVKTEAAFLKPKLEECERASNLKHPACISFARNQKMMVDVYLPATESCSKMGVFPFPENERQEYIDLVLSMLRTTRKIRAKQ